MKYDQPLSSNTSLKVVQKYHYIRRILNLYVKKSGKNIGIHTLTFFPGLERALIYALSSSKSTKESFRFTGSSVVDSAL